MAAIYTRNQNTAMNNLMGLTSYSQTVVVNINSESSQPAPVTSGVPQAKVCY